MTFPRERADRRPAEGENTIDVFAVEPYWQELHHKSFDGSQWYINTRARSDLHTFHVKKLLDGAFSYSIVVRLLMHVSDLYRV